MVFETISKFITTVRSLRQLDQQTPEILRAVAARSRAAVAAAERKQQEQNENTTKLADAVATRVDEHKEQMASAALARAAAHEQKLDDILKVDHAALQRKAIGGLLDKWEAALEGGDPRAKGGDGGSSPAKKGR